MPPSSDGMSPIYARCSVTPSPLDAAVYSPERSLSLLSPIPYLAFIEDVFLQSVNDYENETYRSVQAIHYVGDISDGKPLCWQLTSDLKHIPHGTDEVEVEG